MKSRSDLNQRITKRLAKAEVWILVPTPYSSQSNSRRIYFTQNHKKRKKVNGLFPQNSLQALLTRKLQIVTESFSQMTVSCKLQIPFIVHGVAGMPFTFISEKKEKMIFILFQINYFYHLSFVQLSATPRMHLKTNCLIKCAQLSPFPHFIASCP